LSDEGLATPKASQSFGKSTVKDRRNSMGWKRRERYRTSVDKPRNKTRVTVTINQFHFVGCCDVHVLEKM
jgi:hypothetical protein